MEGHTSLCKDMIAQLFAKWLVSSITTKQEISVAINRERDSKKYCNITEYQQSVFQVRCGERV